MILFWEYSSMYKGYLKDKVKEEYDKYRKSLHGIENGNKDEVDPDYKSVYGDYKIEKKGVEDDSLEPLNKHLYDRLVEIASPSKWTLVGSYIKFKTIQLIKCFNDTFQVSLSLPGAINISITPNDEKSFSLSQYKTKEPTLDFSKEYDDYLKWKKNIKSSQRGIADYCKSHNINAKDMIAWVRVYKPSVISTRNGKRTR